MPPHIFLTGATGYIGGTALSHLTHTPSSLSNPTITALVRTPLQASILEKAHPCVNTVIGTLDSHNLLFAEAAKADLVLNAADADHEAGVLALLEGLGSKNKTADTSPGGGKGSRKGVLVHISGSANLIDLPSLSLSPGTFDSKTWSDTDTADASTILSLPPDRIHAALEQKIIRVGEASGVDTVILSPAAILGRGTGTGKRESFGEEYVRAVMRYGAAFVLGEGRNATGWSSVGDVAGAIALIVREAVGDERSGKLGFGRQGYYFIESGEIDAWQRAEFVGEKLKVLGKLESEVVAQIDGETAAGLHPYGALMWGANVRSRGEKVRGLGWEPREVEWRILVGEAVEREVEMVNFAKAV